jgi:cation transport protein ChaC
MGYRRRFNKASISNWGTKNSPCPTLNVEKYEGALCEGLAFEFSDELQQEVLSYLIEREGDSFEFQKHMIILENLDPVEAHIPIYVGKNILREDTDALSNMAMVAGGTRGTCKDYIANLELKLNELNIRDCEVKKFVQFVKQKEAEGPSLIS